MPAKNLEDLTGDHFLEVEIAFESPSKIYEVYKYSTGDRIDIDLCKEAKTIPIAHISLSFLHLEQPVWMVSQSGADDGWGPMIYDAAMELATERGAGLIPEAYGITPAALSLWQYYLDFRSNDVHTAPFGPLPWKTVSHPVFQLRFMKTPSTVLSHFRRNGRLELV